MTHEHPINKYSLNLINSIWPPALAVKSFIRKSRENAACWMLVIFFWHVIDQSEEYRELAVAITYLFKFKFKFVIQHK